MNSKHEDTMEWLQKWYQQYCDGDWEHDEHFHIRNIDNPGWRVTINVAGTCCEDQLFESIRREISATDWYHCFVRNGKFEGACGPNNLMKVLDVFKEWASHCERENSY